MSEQRSITDTHCITDIYAKAKVPVVIEKDLNDSSHF